MKHWNKQARTHKDYTRELLVEGGNKQDADLIINYSFLLVAEEIGKKERGVQ